MKIAAGAVILGACVLFIANASYDPEDQLSPDLKAKYSRLLLSWSGCHTHGPSSCEKEWVDLDAFEKQYGIKQ